jgi:transposase InsO family protein
VLDLVRDAPGPARLRKTQQKLSEPARYLHACEPVQEARTKIGRYIEFYNSTRPHSSLKALTPDQVYFNRSPEALAA